MLITVGMRLIDCNRGHLRKVHRFFFFSCLFVVITLRLKANKLTLPLTDEFNERDTATTILLNIK